MEHKIKRKIKVGSRKSELALKQSHIVMDMLKERHDDLDIELITMDTIGDKILNIELSKIGDKSLFTKELELALLTKEVDIVVHSLKDVPTTMSSEFVLGCVCMRENNNDCVVLRKNSPYKCLDDLPEGSIIGTSSVRRIAQLKRKFGDKFIFMSIRGNLNTRFMKLDDAHEAMMQGKGDGQSYDALIIAHAGLVRLGWQSRISEILKDEESLYAVGQGALGCECRSNDHETMKLLSSIHHEESALTSLAERSMMRNLDGGCSTPISARCHIDFHAEKPLYSSDDAADDDEDEDEDDELNEYHKMYLTGRVLSLDGSECAMGSSSCYLPLQEPSSNKRKCYQTEDFIFNGLRVWPICEIGRLRMVAARDLGEEVARILLDKGAGRILGAIVRTRGEIDLNAKSNSQTPVVINNTFTGLNKPTGAANLLVQAANKPLLRNTN